MPIFAPTLPPRPRLDEGMPPTLVLLRFDLRRVVRQKLGKFFGFLFLGILLILCAQLYGNHLMASRRELAELRHATEAFLPQGARFQAQLLHGAMIGILWLQTALVGGGLVARDTLHRVRPLIYAHPVTQRAYLGAKALFAAGLPFCVMLAYILLPWGLSLAIAGAGGPVWPTAPLRLIPAAALIAALMGAVTLGASSLAASPRAGFGWALGILLGSGALGAVLGQALGDPRWTALGLGTLTKAWPRLVFGLETETGLAAAAAATLFHIGLWTFIAARRTRPEEAVL
ncbi:hypothetical protein [Mesoterricola sediminis]|uniref:Uncharacterized protein n=1 Tax=Mesoterricola sediminis TaxID=2927980 RepID=A0AA48KAX9_9BACT|nr:hypothetical protein [Mesoterricola sediminis]BDU75186.1 hypothetical protein METESE_01440 [Mesoterricola sediminis]